MSVSRHTPSARARIGSRTTAFGSALLLAVGLLAAAPAAPAVASSDRLIHHYSWTANSLTRGLHRGTVASHGRLTMAEVPQARRTTKDGTTWAISRWTSPWVRPGFDLTELIPSWNARTPGRSRIKILVRARSGARVGSWDTVAHWAAGDAHLTRRSGASQPDDLGRLDVDTWLAHDTVDAWRVRVVFRKVARAKNGPSVTRIGATASRLPDSVPATSAPLTKRQVELTVPRFSQMAHQGSYQQWGGGGQAWCSPTSTAMVLAFHGRLPGKKAYSWVADGHPDPWVVHAARGTYDHRYRGTGNWPFNTAYAGLRAGGAFVTRLRSLREAEEFIAAGIPLIVSISFGAGQLSGAPITATNGHLVVIVGFTSTGDVIVNDPAAAHASGVRRVYSRSQFERAWMSRSKGLSYVIHAAGQSLPPSRGNW
ncbi:peptidase C39 family protein [Nocardioides limicola]|uniref:peptidase C39 family protein n=1 Tax=Nocardioides limicola TaxID=2803368 RepID=UPI00193B8DD3|nr:peptidase C39 family protein [Nocardioides sp. DJM-14]